MARGLRRTVRTSIDPASARRGVAVELAGRGAAFLESLDRLVWPHADSPTRRLLDAIGAERGDVRALVGEHGLDGALEHLRDRGVYVAYEEYHGRQPAQRGSTELHFTPSDFFNPLVAGDYLGSTGGSRGSGTPVELSFAWQRRQGRQRSITYDMLGVRGAPSAIWLPVLPSAAGFGALMKTAAGGNLAEHWFSQVPTDVGGISAHKGLANRFLPVLTKATGTGLPTAEHVPGDDPDPVLDWLTSALRREGRAVLTGYASSITAAARRAVERGIDLRGAVAFPASEPVTTGKLEAMRAAGLRAFPMYAFVPEGTAAIACDEGPDEEYHLWAQDLAVVTRRRSRGDGTDVDALCLTSLALEAPRVMVNVENDDYGTLGTAACGCGFASLGLTSTVGHIRGISKVVAAGVSVDGHLFDELTEVALPRRLGGGPGDYQFVEHDGDAGTALHLRVHPRVGPVAESDARRVVDDALAGSDNGRLAGEVWGTSHTLVIERLAPSVTRAGKVLSFERLAATPPAPRPTPEPESEPR